MMAYAKDFVATIIGPDEKPLRELNESGKRTARLAFNSEYKIRLKNKTAARALAHVEIDGTVVTNAGKLVLNPGQTFDLERFLDSLTEGKRFKFAKVTHSDVQDPTSSENGCIRVTFEPECVMPKIATPVKNQSPPTVWYGMTHPGFGNQFMVQPIGSINAQNDGGTFASTNSFVMPDAVPKASDLGATVEGTHSGQAFSQSGEYFPTFPATVIEIWLKGPKVDLTAPRPFTIQTQHAGVPLFNGIAMTGCNIYPSDGYTQISIPNEMIEWKAK